MLIVFAKRQSPDWAGIAADYRRGVAIDPARYAPARQNLAAVQGAVHFDHDDVEGLLDLAERRAFWLFFHDDDDFFADGMMARLEAVDIAADTCVFPLPRVHQDLVTFAPTEGEIEFVYGRRVPFFHHFHTNNYGIHSRVCTAENLRGLKDHIDGSIFALKAGLTRAVLPFVVSATVKTPCSASMLPALLSDPPLFMRQMGGFAARFREPRLPATYSWLERPLRQIAEIFVQISADFSARARTNGG